MAELTIHLPDELMSRLELLRERLPQLLEQILLSMDTDPSTVLKKTSNTTASMSVYAEVLDFLLQSPTPKEIITFKVSPQTQECLQTLLQKNREVTLSAEEIAELDAYEQLEHLMLLLKARVVNSIN